MNDAARKILGRTLIVIGLVLLLAVSFSRFGGASRYEGEPYMEGFGESVGPSGSDIRSVTYTADIRNGSTKAYMITAMELHLNEAFATRVTDPLKVNNTKNLKKKGHLQYSGSFKVNVKNLSEEEIMKFMPFVESITLTMERGEKIHLKTVAR